MKNYQSIKKVQAAKIVGITVKGIEGADLELEGGEHVHCEAEMFARYTAKEGDYLVVYEPDGYRSISPAGVFEQGYVEIQD